MEALGLYEGREDRVIPLKYSDRSKTPIEPYLSDQWFVKMADRDDGKPGLAQLAMDAVSSGRVRFFPERYANTYLDWLGEKRDWCISRQLWWGHQIPVWSKTEKAHKMFGEGAALLSELIKVSAEEGLPEIAQLAQQTKQRIYDSSRKELKQVVLAHLDKNYKKEWLDYVELDYLLHDSGEITFLFCLRQDIPELIELLTSKGYTRDPDVLDTWFSSALWPHSTLGWPEPTPEVAYYYPTSTLVTSRDIITLWVARMVLTGLFNLNEVPFRHVYIHPKILDGFGETMSKGKGNGVDPLDIIDLYGTDALRFGIVNIATETQDSRMPVTNVCPHCGAAVPVKQEHMYGRTKKLACPQCKKPFRPGGPWPSDDPELPTAKQGSDRFEIGRNFANKLWNAARFLQMNLDGYTPGPVSLADLPTEDRWIVSRLATTATAVTAALEDYKFADVAKLLYEFTWSEFCDWYIEMSKGRLADPAARPLAQRVLVGVLHGILRLVHPVMPFVAESLWQGSTNPPRARAADPAKGEESVCIAEWPTYPAEWVSADVEARFARMQDLVRGVREVRNRYQVDPKTKLDVTVKCGEAVASDFRSLGPFIGHLAGVGVFTASPDTSKPKQAGTVVRPDFEAYVSLAGLIDPAAEAKRTEKQIADIRKQLAGMTAKLGNESYVKNAPAEVVQETRAKVAELEAQVRALEGNLKELQEG
ncbi:MAG: class I tRNA ligase family protein [Gemmataceae bacterium]